MRVSTDCARAIVDAASKASAAVPANRMCWIINASWICGRRSLRQLLDISWFPTVVDRRFGRAVEPQNREIALARHRGEPVAVLAVRGFGAEVEVGTAVGVRRRLVARAERGERLAVGEARGVL